MVAKWMPTEEQRKAICELYTQGVPATRIMIDLNLPIRHHLPIYRTLREGGVPVRSASGYGFLALKCEACGDEYEQNMGVSKPKRLCGTCAPSPRWRVRYARFGITKPMFLQMLKDQVGLCAMCSEPLPDMLSAIKIDHCHETGRIRGLLCNGCNVGLGWVEKPGFLTLANAYLGILPATLADSHEARYNVAKAELERMKRLLAEKPKVVKEYVEPKNSGIDIVEAKR